MRTRRQARQPGAGERVVMGVIVELVPGVIDGIDFGHVRSPQRLLKLQVVGRVGEDQVDACGGKFRQHVEAVAANNLIER